MIPLAAALALVVGVVLGLLGGGGSILTLPILVYALGVPTQSAIATSLIVVGIASIAAAVPHARAGSVRWRLALSFGGLSMLGAYGGGSLARFVPGALLLVLFAGVMTIAGVGMLRRRPTAHKPSPSTRRGTLLVQALFVGAFTGLVGAGGGFIVVPALVLLGGLTMRAAVGTSLVIIVMQSMAGAAGHLGHVHIDLTLTSTFAVAAVVGAWIGARLSRRISADRLRVAFGAFVLVMASLILAAELSALL